MTRKVAVIGGGSWGTTLADRLARGGHAVRLWVYEAELVDAINRDRENPLYLPGIRLHQEVVATHDAADAAEGVEFVFNVVPAQAARSVFTPLASFLPPGQRVISASKGIENGSLLLMSDLLAELLGEEGRGHIGVLSGPTFAREVAEGKPTALVAACAEESVARGVQELLRGPSLRVYTSRDVVGVSLGGAYKNVVAVAAGICDGLRLGENARAALITRGLAEMTRLGVLMGANALSFAGLSGVGDLVLTCSSPTSRNFTVGRRLGEGEKLADILRGMIQVAEGVQTAASVVGLARRHGVELPIADKTYQIVHEGADPMASVRSLMERGPRPELDYE